MNIQPFLSIVWACLLIAASPVGALAVSPTSKRSNDSAKSRFFESKVRPILVRRCFSCHGPRKHKSGLRLDSRTGMLRGGESGAVIAPGHPDDSRIVDVIRYADDDIKMPPQGKLPAEDIAVLIAWIRTGATWPNSTKTTAVGPTSADRFDYSGLRKTHWAFRPVTRPTIPAVKDRRWARTAVDRFVLARLEDAGLTPSSPADRRTFIRRITFDLRGMPPTLQEVEAFLGDTSPDAVARVVDRLLASPEYGERWGRHWLDVARYADTKGYIFGLETRYPYAYTYRDYVIQAFNEDLPYDRFLMEQIAADQIPSEGRPKAQAAMGFLTVGRRLFNNPHDIIDDRIDVVCRGLLGLTVGCARCHDHKYDPIPMADYYSLYGIFASSREPSDLPSLGLPNDMAAYQKFLTEHAKREQAYRKKLEQGYQELRDQLRSQMAVYLLAVLNRRNVNEKTMRVFHQGDFRPGFVLRWRRYLKAAARKNDPVFTLWHQLVVLPPGDFAQRAQQVIHHHAATTKIANPGGPQTVNRWVLAAFVLHPPKSRADVVKTYAQLLRDSDQPPQTLFKRYQPHGVQNRAGITATKAGRSSQPPDRDLRALRDVLSGPGSPIALHQNDIRLFNRKTQSEAMALKSQLERLPIISPGAPPRAMVMVDRPHPLDPQIFIRGNPARRGKSVPRRFLEILSGPHDEPFHIGSGRLELARAVADSHNPLTARVLVNRVWMHHFGRGLVRTPSNFGLQAEPPTHPQLLDYLAWKFVSDGWSIKRLHREILLSAVYQQQSTPSLAAATAGKRIDPENRLLWRMNRHRLEFEAMRDSILFVSDRLDRRMTGRSVNIEKRPFSSRRTVYALVNRNDLPNMFRTFDFPSPDASAARRPVTVVPQQALFDMNSPFVMEQAQLLARRAKVASAAQPADKLRALYRCVFARDPNPTESAAVLRYVRNASVHKTAQPQRSLPKRDHKKDRRLGVWERVAQMLLLTNEFLFVD